MVGVGGVADGFKCVKDCFEFVAGVSVDAFQAEFACFFELDGGFKA